MGISVINYSLSSIENTIICNPCYDRKHVFQFVMLVAHLVKKRYNENRMDNEEWTQAIIHRMKTSKGKTHHTKLKDEPRTPPPKNSGLNQSAREG